MIGIPYVCIPNHPYQACCFPPSLDPAWIRSTRKLDCPGLPEYEYTCDWRIEKWCSVQLNHLTDDSSMRVK